MGIVPKKFICTHCDRETYAFYDECEGCGQTDTIERIDRTKEENELRQKLHNAIDVMTYDQLRVLNNFMFR